MLEIALQIIFCLILAALLGGIIGYLLGKSSCKESLSPDEHLNLIKSTTDSNHGQTNLNVQSETSIETGTQPTLLTSPREGKRDNLQLIKGVGAVLENVLNDIGIYHFDQIANLTTKEVTWLDSSIAFPGRIEREDWIIQARELAKGKSTEFSQRVERGEVATSQKSK